jgi:CheY-like chemotaxis protein
MTSAGSISDLPDGDPAAAGEAAQPRLLVIDDDATPRMVIAKLAQKLGYATWEASTIAEATAVIARLRMGGRYGTELLETMSRQQPGVPVIVVSSADDDERWEVLRVASLYGIRVTEVPKPLEIPKLRAVFEEIRYLA